MSTAILVVMVVLTSLGAYLVGTRRLGLPPAGLRQAGARTLDGIGLGIVFLLVNLVIGAMVILGLRVLSGQFVSLYALNDGVIVILSALQATVVQWWRDAGR